MDKVKLFLYLFICSISGASCASSIPEVVELKLSLSENGSVGKIYNGQIGRITVNFDREEGHRTYAIFKMENIVESERAVSFVRLNVFDKDCYGSPFGLFEYNRFSYDQQALPQSFAIGRESCVVVEYYHQDIYGQLSLVDEFKIFIEN